MSNVNLEEAKGLIKVINDKKQQFKEIYDKVNLKNSEISKNKNKFLHFGFILFIKTI